MSIATIWKCAFLIDNKYTMEMTVCSLFSSCFRLPIWLVENVKLHHIAGPKAINVLAILLLAIVVSSNYNYFYFFGP